MKLTGLIISNFKAFKDDQTIPIRPITLIYGANSSGKSSIIHALALAHEANRTNNLDVHETVIGGESIDLGGFRQYVHRRDSDQPVLLGFELSSSAPENSPESLHSAKDVTLFASIETDPLGSDGYVNASPSENLPSFVRIMRFALFVDDEEILHIGRQPYTEFERSLRPQNLNYNHKVIREIVNKIFTSNKIDFKSDENRKSAEEIIESVILKNCEVHASGVFPYIPLDQMPAINANLSASSPFIPPNQIPPIEGPKDLVDAIYRDFPNALGTFVNDAAQKATDVINKLQYLGPLRSYPPRRFVSVRHHNANWYAGGGHAWNVISRNDEVRARINAWLAPDRLDTPYKLVTRSLIELEELEHIIAEVLEEVAEKNYAGVEDGEDGWNYFVNDLKLNGKKLVLQRIGEYAKDRFIDPVLVDLRANTEVSHRDVGVGISQVLPVLVSAYASQGKLIAIEQPEIHLHPALQTELGDVFIESALGEDTKNTLLLETHSEHLLLRIMRRMRETCDGTLPEGIPKVRPEDVMVLFVEPHESGSIVREMPLNERGELVKAWPRGFFEEGFREVFSGTA